MMVVIKCHSINDHSVNLAFKVRSFAERLSLTAAMNVHEGHDWCHVSLMHALSSQVSPEDLENPSAAW